MTTLITGVAGFIGSHVAKACLDRGHEVVGLDDLSGGYRSNVPAHVEFIEGSVVNVPLVERMFLEHKFDRVFHLAAYAAEGLSHFIRRFNYENNVIGSINLINACVRSETVQRFVFTSSIAVYGRAQTPMVEATIPQPEDPYGVGKYAVELDLKAAHEMFGLDYTILRPHNVYGEHQNIGDRYRNVVGIFMNQVMHGRPMSVFGDGKQTRAFTYIADVAPVIAQCADEDKARNEVFNIGSDEVSTVIDVASYVAQAFDVEPVIEHLDARNEVVHAFADHRKLEAVIRGNEKTSLQAGIKRMAEWARVVGARETQRFEKIEIWKNLPQSWR